MKKTCRYLTSKTEALQADNTDNSKNMENTSSLDIMKAMQVIQVKQDFQIEMDGLLAAIKIVHSDITCC